MPNQEKKCLEARCIKGLVAVDKSQQTANKIPTKNKNLCKKLTKQVFSDTLSTKAEKEKKMATEKKRVQVSFTEEQHQMLVDLAKNKGFSKSAIIVLALEEYLKNQEQN